MTLSYKGVRNSCQSLKMLRSNDSAQNNKWNSLAHIVAPFGFHTPSVHYFTHYFQPLAHMSHNGNSRIKYGNCTCAFLCPMALNNWSYLLCVLFSKLFPNTLYMKKNRLYIPIQIVYNRRLQLLYYHTQPSKWLNRFNCYLLLPNKMNEYKLSEFILYLGCFKCSFHVRIQIYIIGNELQLKIEYISANNNTYKYIKKIII